MFNTGGIDVLRPMFVMLYIETFSIKLEVVVIEGSWLLL